MQIPIIGAGTMIESQQMVDIYEEPRCSQCGKDEEANFFAPMIDITVVVCDHEEGYANVRQWLCAQCSIPILDMIRLVGFVNHEHGGTCLLPDPDCVGEGPWHQPDGTFQNPCPTPSEYGQYVVPPPDQRAPMQQFTFEMDGYCIADRLLEGVGFNVTVTFAEDITPQNQDNFPYTVTDVKVAEPRNPYMAQFVIQQHDKWCEQIKQYAQRYGEYFYEAYCEGPPEAGIYIPLGNIEELVDLEQEHLQQER
jgi:hypothetical protein